MASPGGPSLQLLGAEISTLAPLHYLGEINGVSRRVVGIFKPSLTRCQQNQPWKQMVMTRTHARGREPHPTGALLSWAYWTGGG